MVTEIQQHQRALQHDVNIINHRLNTIDSTMSSQYDALLAKLDNILISQSSANRNGPTTTPRITNVTNQHHTSTNPNTPSNSTSTTTSAPTPVPTSTHQPACYWDTTQGRAPSGYNIINPYQQRTAVQTAPTPVTTPSQSRGVLVSTRI